MHHKMQCYKIAKGLYIQSGKRAGIQEDDQMFHVLVPFGQMYLFGHLLL